MTLKQIREYYCSVFHMEQPEIIDLVVALAFGVHISGDPIWLMIVGGSGTGKSELVNILSSVSNIHPLSTLTENTFLSGLRSFEGKETSFLTKIGNKGMILMKDYTTILALHGERQASIAAQMREIYDGKLTKETGNGKSLHWEGRIFFLGASTDMIYIFNEKTAGMGQRMLYYVMPEQNRSKMLYASLNNLGDIQTKRKTLQEMVALFVEQNKDSVASLLPLPKDFETELMELINFSTIARTPTIRDYHGTLRMVLDSEAPMRIFKQVYFASQLLVAIGGELKPEYRQLIKKICIDCIPKMLRKTLHALACFKTVTTKGLSQFLNYPTKTAGDWLQDLNVLGLVTRSVGVNKMDEWQLKEKYRQLLLKHVEGLWDRNRILEADDSVEEEARVSYDLGEIEEKEKNTEEAFENAFGKF